MQEALTNDRVHVEPYHSGLWWREVLRGGVTILFALLMLFTFNFFIVVLGIYLMLDGALEMLPMGSRATKRAFLTYLGGLVSIALGLFCLLNQGATLFLLVVVAIRLIYRGGRMLLDARHSQYTYEGLTWLLGIVLLLVGLVFLGTAVWSVLAHRVPFSLIIFVRYAGAYGLGHVGWAFEWNNGWFNVGSLENEQGKPFSSPQEMGFWSAPTLDPIEDMQRRGMSYDAYKVLYVRHPCPKEAWKTVIWESRQPYAVLRHNCSDVVYDILRAYGTGVLLDPMEEPAPNDWYDALPGRSYLIVDHPTIPLHLHQTSKRELATREILLTIPEHVQATPPPWRVKGWRVWQEVDGMFFARKGAHAHFVWCLKGLDMVE